jgi:hypothetical protein
VNSKPRAGHAALASTTADATDCLCGSVSAGARYSGYVDIALAGDIPAEGYRADELHADKIRAEGASESFRYLITEHGDFGREHPAIIRHARARLTAHHADPVEPKTFAQERSAPDRLDLCGGHAA